MSAAAAALLQHLGVGERVAGVEWWAHARYQFGASGRSEVRLAAQIGTAAQQHKVAPLCMLTLQCTCWAEARVCVQGHPLHYDTDEV